MNPHKIKAREILILCDLDSYYVHHYRDWSLRKKNNSSLDSGGCLNSNSNTALAKTERRDITLFLIAPTHIICVNLHFTLAFTTLVSVWMLVWEVVVDTGYVCGDCIGGAPTKKKRKKPYAPPIQSLIWIRIQMTLTAYLSIHTHTLLEG